MDQKLFNDFRGNNKLYHPNINILENKVSLHLNESAYPPPNKCIDTISGMSQIRLHQYERGGTLPLEKKLADIHNVSYKNILIDNGSCEVLKHIIFSLNENCHKVLLPINGWAYNNKLMFLKNLVTDYYELDCNDEIGSYNFNINNIKYHIDIFEPDVLILVTPNAFSGNIMSRYELIDILEYCDSNTLIIVDQAYSEYSYNDDIVVSELIQKYQNLVFTRTLSKFYALANIRIGYAISNEKNINYFKHYSSVFGASGVSQAIACNALSDLEYYNRIKQKIVETRTCFIQEVNKLKNFIAYTSEANFVLVKVIKEDATCVIEEVYNQGIVLGSCRKYGLDNHIRVTIGDDETMSRLLNILKRLDVDTNERVTSGSLALNAFLG